MFILRQHLFINKCRRHTKKIFLYREIIAEGASAPNLLHIKANHSLLTLPMLSKDPFEKGKKKASFIILLRRGLAAKI